MYIMDMLLTFSICTTISTMVGRMLMKSHKNGSKKPSTGGGGKGKYINADTFIRGGASGRAKQQRDSVRLGMQVIVYMSFA